MQHEPGDDYIRRISSFIRTHERGLAEAGAPPRRRRIAKPGVASAEAPSVFNPLAWFSAGNPAPYASPPPVKPIVLTLDTHRLFYILIRLEALGIDVGSLDVRVDSPSKPMNYINIFPNSDKSDTLSLASFRSSLSAVSGLSLGGGWWARTEPPTVDAELKFIYSSFTKIPALCMKAPGPKSIAELANEPPNENALPMDSFKNLQTLECQDIDPRTLLGWDRLAESLRSLTVKRSGLEDVTDIFIAAVVDDQARREGGHISRRTITTRGPSRQSSFYSTPLPESVPEDAEETPRAQEDVALPSTPRALSSMKWAFLKHLSLADNALTFFPTDALPYLTSLTHLDLSSNLLVSVPAGLSALYNLVSLNLSDNMIDTVLAIYQNLGQVLNLNLSRNRLESICGLERLPALERVDLRDNVIEETAEIGRLATLPHIQEVWIEGNPLVDYEENYRVTCFDLFWKEGKTVMLDGAAPGFYEKRGLSALPPEQMSSTRPISTAYSPPVVAVGSPRFSPKVEAADASQQKTPQLAAADSSPASHSSPKLHAAAVDGKHRRKKNKRIVELDAREPEQSDNSASHPRVTRHRKATSNAGSGGVPGSRATRTPSPQKKSTSHDAPPPPAPVETKVVSRNAPRFRHSRSHTEAPGASSYGDDTVPSLPTTMRIGNKSAARRARASASVYEPPPTVADGPEGQLRDADAYRARIEALRSDMGDGWLTVFSQTQMSKEGVASG
ncbi:hypothetical protein PLICRDRAFT_37305 [Plicaturopsis crispa FD-325 SS-3]|nr:hypothetical protein PLICRDRAFT_37305 [Plicaturopsis crispa FD-325 SS-3]